MCRSVLFYYMVFSSHGRPQKERNAIVEELSHVQKVSFLLFGHLCYGFV